jgi:hypothetical protein
VPPIACRRHSPSLIIPIQPALREAVERMHHCKATYKGSESIKEEFRGEPVWEGDVHTFALSGHATANTCYAWSPLWETHITAPSF